MARALASVYTYRSASVPLLILAESRNEYIAALQRADAGDFQPFVDFMFERAIDAIRLAQDSLRAGEVGSLQETAGRLKRLFHTEGGYSHEQVDEAGYRLLTLFEAELRRNLDYVAQTGLCSYKLDGIRQLGHEVPPMEVEQGYRRPVSQGPRIVQIGLEAVQPAGITLFRSIELLVPQDCGLEDDLILVDRRMKQRVFEARINDLVPTERGALPMRVAIAAESFVAEFVDELAKAADTQMRKRGY